MDIGEAFFFKQENPRRCRGEPVVERTLGFAAATVLPYWLAEFRQALPVALSMPRLVRDSKPLRA
jgi:hypothetical protein